MCWQHFEPPLVFFALYILSDFYIDPLISSSCSVCLFQASSYPDRKWEVCLCDVKPRVVCRCAAGADHINVFWVVIVECSHDRWGTLLIFSFREISFCTMPLERSSRRTSSFFSEENHHQRSPNLDPWLCYSIQQITAEKIPLVTSSYQCFFTTFFCSSYHVFAADLTWHPNIVRPPPMCFVAFSRHLVQMSADWRNTGCIMLCISALKSS